MPYAYPTSEHYTPLFVAIGAGNDTSPVQTTIDGYAWNQDHLGGSCASTRPTTISTGQTAP